MNKKDTPPKKDVLEDRENQNKQTDDYLYKSIGAIAEIQALKDLYNLTAQEVFLLHTLKFIEIHKLNYDIFLKELIKTKQ